MPNELPDFESMSDEEVKERFMSLASNLRHRRQLQALINALLEEYPDLTEGALLRSTLMTIWEEIQPVGHTQHQLD